MGYPLFFVLSLYPAFLFSRHLISEIGEEDASEWVKLILFALAMFTLFNFFYGIINLMVNGQKNFHETYNSSNLNKGSVKLFRDNENGIKNAAHFFFYTGGVILYAIVIYQSKI
ncbi:hypothetical protein [Sphingobacterium bovistauri]|uniref:DUF4149 domain-containing protein n=1 Tax=Sphingobacterium bovistauri TaxID=2781959 RepID=A0ABS7Z4Y3_9SPHI|nr:hypothetical protein [Sphingobacterium bovistauri]MCA5005258.1 hypothetical protein [Sphingobacterium bovistauri]